LLKENIPLWHFPQTLEFFLLVPISPSDVENFPVCPSLVWGVPSSGHHDNPESSCWIRGKREVKASSGWLATTGAPFSAGTGRTGCAHLQHYTVAYREWGEGPPLVLVPGLAGGYELLGPLARALARHFRVISYQLRGEDDCFALRRPFGIRDLVEDLAEFLDWHGLESPALLGVSFGGVLALEFAARFPYRLEQLVVQGAGARFERGLLQQIAGTVLNRYPLPSDNPFINQFFNLLFGSRQKPGPLFQFVTRLCWQTDQSVMAHRFRLVEHFDLERRLPRIRVPTLILGAERDLLVSELSLNDLCAGIEHSHLVRLAGCGHLAFVTQPGRVAEEARRFLCR
jgi:pimeloyl-ACP methyl ester carboxylesterase